MTPAGPGDSTILSRRKKRADVLASSSLFISRDAEMRKGRPSLTALAVAAARAMASGTHGAVLDPKDRVAELLLPRPISTALQSLRSSGLARDWLVAAASHASLGMVDHIALRTAAIDDLLSAAVERGVRQVVILGAGFDTRAQRLHALRSATVYEVDHPDSQREKRARSQGLPLVANALERVALDLARGELQQRLAEAGHRSSEPSFFIAEGLVPYLEPAVVGRVLREVALASAGGSQLVVTYVTPDLVWLRHTKALLLAFMHLIGEPMQTLLSAQEMASLLSKAGFTLEQDTDTRDWAHALCPPGRRQPLIAYERLALGFIVLCRDTPALS
jgi:methyltransferase (TIGR00027 family)